MLFAVEFQAQLEGIRETGLNLAEGLHLMVRCARCREGRPGPVHLDPASWDALGTNDRAQANLVFSCKFCRCSQNMTVVRDSERTYSAEAAPGPAPLLLIECRGTEPTAVVPQEGMMWAVAESGTRFVAITLPEWFEYDEAAKESVSVTEAGFTVS